MAAVSNLNEWPSNGSGSPRPKADRSTDDAFEWTESRYDTRVALERAKQLRDGGFALTLRVVGCLCQVRDESYRQWERTVRLANTVG